MPYPVPVIAASGTPTQVESGINLGGVIQCVSGGPLVAWEWTVLSSPRSMADFGTVNGSFASASSTSPSPTFFVTATGVYQVSVRARNPENWSAPVVLTVAASATESRNTDEIQSSEEAEQIASDVQENSALAGVALLGATTAAMNLYVDPVAGLDTNPGTLALPFQTIAAALAAVPQTIKHVVTINLANGDYDEYLYPAHRLRGGVLIIRGNLRLVAGEIDRLADAAKCSSYTIGTSLAGWGIDSNDDKWVELTAGIGVGQVRKVKSNTTDTLTTTRPFFPVPDGTTHYQIVTPAARITGYLTEYPAVENTAIYANDMGGTSSRSFILYNLDLVNGSLHIAGSTCLAAGRVAMRRQLHVQGSTGFFQLGSTYYVDDAGVVQFADYNGGVYIEEDSAYAINIWNNTTYSNLNYSVVKGQVRLDGACLGIYKSRLKDGTNTHRILLHGVTESGDTTFNQVLLDGITDISINESKIKFDGSLANCSGGFRLKTGCSVYFYSLTGSGNTGPIIQLTDSDSLVAFDLGVVPTVTVVGGGLYKAGNRPVGTVWADLTTYGPDDDGADQKLVRAVPANPGPWTIALGVALNGMLASGLVRVHDITAGAVLAEVAPAPGAGQFSVDYATGVVTFNTAEQTHTVAIYYRPVSYTGARIG